MEKFKVYDINDCDLVAARNEEEAKTWYEQFIPREEIEEFYEGEASL